MKTGGTWKTIAIFGLRRGGNYYYALDITNPTSPSYLWSFTDTNLGETWSEPAIGKIKMRTAPTSGWPSLAAVSIPTFANYSAGSKVSEAFFAIDLATGAKLWEYYNATGSTDDRQYMNFSVPASPTAVDLNGDGYIDRVYIADFGGQLWKFDVAPTGGTIVVWRPGDQLDREALVYRGIKPNKSAGSGRVLSDASDVQSADACLRRKR